MTSTPNSAVYGYANARVRAMRSKLLGKRTLLQLSDSSDVKSMIGTLIQTDYRDYLDQFGGVKADERMVDFALNRSFEQNVDRLIGISPNHVRKPIAAIVSGGDYESMKLLLHAKHKGLAFDSISKYLVGSRRLSLQRMKAAISENTVEEAAKTLGEGTPYSAAISAAMDAYKKTGSLADADLSLDMDYYLSIGSAANRLMVESPESARLVRMEIESRNLLTAMRMKRANAPPESFKKALIPNGITGHKELVDSYSSSSPSEIAGISKAFRLEQSRSMLDYEIQMRGQLLRKAISVLGSSVLSFGAIVAYYYMKRAEIATVRAILNGAAYGVKKDEIKGMII